MINVTLMGKTFVNNFIKTVITNIILYQLDLMKTYMK